MRTYDVSCARCGDAIASDAKRFELTSLDHADARSSTVEATYCEHCARILIYAATA